MWPTLRSVEIYIYSYILSVLYPDKTYTDDDNHEDYIRVLMKEKKIKEIILEKYRQRLDYFKKWNEAREWRLENNESIRADEALVHPNRIYMGIMSKGEQALCGFHSYTLEYDGMRFNWPITNNMSAWNIPRVRQDDLNITNINMYLKKRENNDGLKTTTNHSTIFRDNYRDLFIAGRITDVTEDIEINLIIDNQERNDTIRVQGKDKIYETIASKYGYTVIIIFGETKVNDEQTFAELGIEEGATLLVKFENSFTYINDR